MNKSQTEKMKACCYPYRDSSGGLERGSKNPEWLVLEIKANGFNWFGAKPKRSSP